MSTAADDPTFPYEKNFARILDVASHRVEMAFDLDPERWPWLMLPAQHPVRVEQYQYFGSVTALRACLPAMPGRFSALTHYRWRCPQALDAPPTRGTCQVSSGKQNIGFALEIFSDDGQCSTRMSGEGVFFADRDFKLWRRESREEVLGLVGSKPLTSAPAELLGILPGATPFVSDPLQQDGAIRFRVRVGREEGFHPRHLFHTGSGDHVNAAQQLDCVMQASHRIVARQQADVAPNLMNCLGGDMRFRRFVELDAPFDLICIEDASADQGLRHFRYRLEQAGRLNSEIGLSFATH